MKKSLKISFGKSSSKRFKDALELCSKLGFSKDGELYTIVLSFKDIFNKWEYVNSLLNIVDKWSSFEICLNDIVCTTNKDYRKIFYDIQDVKTCYNRTKENNCSCNTEYESGCWRVDNIIFNIHSFESAYKGWYKYGHLVKESIWVIDKAKIREEIAKEAQRQNAFLCPLYDFGRLNIFLKNSPDTIDVSDERIWKIDYEDVLTDKGVESIPETITYLKSDRFTFDHLKNTQTPRVGIEINFDINNQKNTEGKDSIINNLTEDERANMLIDEYLRNKKQQ